MPVVGQILAGKPRSSGTGPQALYSEKLIQDLQQARRDADVKAVVLRVDSPGVWPLLDKPSHSEKLLISGLPYFRWAVHMPFLDKPTSFHTIASQLISRMNGINRINGAHRINKCCAR